MNPLLIGSLVCGGLGLSMLLPGPRSRGAIAWGGALLGLAAIGLTIALWGAREEGVRADVATGWVIGILGTLTLVAGVAAVALPGERRIHAYGSAIIGVGLLLGLTVGWMIGLSSVAMQLVTWFRLAAIDEGADRAERGRDQVGQSRMVSEPLLAAIAGTLLAATLLVALQAWVPVPAGEPHEDRSGLAPSTSLLVMGGALLLIGLGFVGLVDEPGESDDANGEGTA